MLDFNNIEITYEEYSKSLVDALKSELIRSGAKVTSPADKTLKVAVKEVNLSLSTYTYNGLIVAEIEMGNGQVERFDVTRSSFGSGFNVDFFPTKPLDAAFVDVVEQVFADEKIRAYLSN